MVCKDSTKKDSNSELTKERQLSKLKKIASLKAMLKEENSEPQSYAQRRRTTKTNESYRKDKRKL